MKKLWLWCKENILFISSIVLLIFIPLYPKFPLLDIKNTWVYVRIEDFLVLAVLFIWGLLALKHRISLKTPITIPIFLFWLSGAIATLHGILLIFPTLQVAYPNVAFLSFLRRMEYISMFFVAYASVKEKKYLGVLVLAIVFTLLSVSLYGIGQIYVGFPAFLTMNEEYAKGLAIHLSRLSRISSTFSGHYDLAAYLVLILPIIASMIFGFRNLFVRVFLVFSAVLGFIALFMTVSRISFFALFVSFGLVLFMHKKKFVLYSIPVVVVLALLFLSLSPKVFERFSNTIKAIDVVVDAKTGDPIGHTKTVPRSYFVDKTVKQQYTQSIKNIYGYASASAMLIVHEAELPEKVTLLLEPSSPTGEDLPQGTGYINLSLSPILQKLDTFLYEPKPRVATTSAEVFVINGNFLVKKVFTYDLSFTTRFQGEWPKAMEAFSKNILFGSGYGSIGLAVDNSYLRMLAEVGLLGFFSFFSIFIIVGVYIKKILPDVDSRLLRSVVIGFTAGLVGLAINALFIDVFEASKVAFVTWIFLGFILGLLRLYERKPVHISKEFLHVLVSTPAIVVYIALTAFLLYSPMTHNYFVGDDFTWFRWASDCSVKTASGSCPVDAKTIVRYFTESNGFFYRPGSKVYFLLMYSLFWLNQSAYHIVSLMLHGVVAILVFFLSKKLLKNIYFALSAGILFLLLNGNAEAVYWVSATGFLFSAVFSLLGLLSFISFEENKERRFVVFSVMFILLSTFFHEVGIVTPILILLYRSIYSPGESMRRLWTDKISKLLFLPVPVYLSMRYISQSHWLSGDYSYNLLRLPLNVAGNSFGYLMLTVFGPISEPLYQIIRTGLKAHVIIAAIIIVSASVVGVWFVRKYSHILEKQDRLTIHFGILFFVVSLLPFLGLGNMSSRYSYLSTIGVIFILIIIAKYLFKSLLYNGKMIAGFGTAVAISAFVLFQIIQQQQITSDWYEAGKRTHAFIVSMGGSYENGWASMPMELHFVNVPIRHGGAWVFPVGMPDALWLLYRNPKLRIFAWPSLSQAFDAVMAGSDTQKVFEFEEKGSVVERIKPQTIQ
ncbi:O-antigen ligase family protein [Candidatus Gottesmanbacteria bacterium]|nr:O-antigen ligase family protein [Candidatus Gottesmanbacteria bacterium]